MTIVCGTTYLGVPYGCGREFEGSSRRKVCDLCRLEHYRAKKRRTRANYTSKPENRQRQRVLNRANERVNRRKNKRISAMQDLSNAGRRYTPQEDALVLDPGLTHRQVSIIIKRSKESVEARATLLRKNAS